MNIAHRGASSVYHENTMAAFREAERMNADMLELDVRLSKDGVPFVHHDAKLKSASAYNGVIEDLTSHEIEQIELISSSGADSEKLKIPTFEDVLKFARGKIALNIEIKPDAVTDDAGNGVEYKCMQLVETYAMEDRVLFSSFDLRVAPHIKQLNSDIAVAILYASQPYRGKLPSDIVDHYSADAFHCTYYQLTQKWMNDLQRNRIPVNIYTVNHVGRMKKLVDLGVNGIITDKPDVLDDVINQ